MILESHSPPQLPTNLPADYVPIYVPHLSLPSITDSALFQVSEFGLHFPYCITRNARSLGYILHMHVLTEKHSKDRHSMA